MAQSEKEAEKSNPKSEQPSQTGSEANQSSENKNQEEDPMKALNTSAESLVKRAFNKGKSIGKKESTNPQAKKGYRIIDNVLKLDKDKLEELTEEKNRKKVIRNVEDAPDNEKNNEALLKYAFANLVLPNAETSEDGSEDTDEDSDESENDSDE